MTSPVRLIVFDLDGTLIDSRRDLAESANALLAESRCGPLPEEQIGRMVGDGAAVLVARAFSAAGCPPPADALGRFLAIYDSRVLKHTRPYPGIGDVLAVLAERSALAVLTNKPLRPAREILSGLDLARFFAPELVLGGDGPFPRKPDAAGLRHLAAAANVQLRDALLVGDSRIDWKTARAAGVRLCVAAYGFGFESLSAGDLDAGDRIVRNPAELLDTL